MTHTESGLKPSFNSLSEYNPFWLNKEQTLEGPFEALNHDRDKYIWYRKFKVLESKINPEYIQEELILGSIQNEGARIDRPVIFSIVYIFEPDGSLITKFIEIESVNMKADEPHFSRYFISPDGKPIRASGTGGAGTRDASIRAGHFVSDEIEALGVIDFEATVEAFIRLVKDGTDFSQPKLIPIPQTEATANQ